MMDQPSFADFEHQGKERKTRRELFLERRDRLIPRQVLEGRSLPTTPRPKSDGVPIHSQ